MAEETPAFARPWIGARCTIVLEREPAEVTVTGVVRSVNCWGEAVVDPDDGVRRYVWPVLDLRSALVSPDDRLGT